MATLGHRPLERDPATEVILLVSKPPAADVAAQRCWATAADKPVVAALLGLPRARRRCRRASGSPPRSRGARWTLLELLGRPRARARRRPGRRGRGGPARGSRRSGDAVRGLFSGGTLCYEALVVPRAASAPVHSNTPLRDGWGLPAPAGAHVCLDLGEEEYTRGRPHPMIDPEARTRAAPRGGRGPATSRWCCSTSCSATARTPTPPPSSSPACAGVLAQAGGPQVVAYVLGTERDPQGYLAPAGRAFEEAGCIVAADRRAGPRWRRPRSRPAAPSSPGSRGVTRPEVALRRPTPPSRAAGSCTPWRWPRRCTGRGEPVQLVALGDPRAGFFRPVDVPAHVVPAPPPAAARSRSGCSRSHRRAGRRARGPGRRRFRHPARAGLHLGPGRRPGPRRRREPCVVVRTVHHVDDFTTPALIDCQRQAILEPDRRARGQRALARRSCGTTTASAADVVRNGVDVARFAPVDRARAGRRCGPGSGRSDRFLFLAVGGIEPRKGSVHLFEAHGGAAPDARARRRCSPSSAATRSRTTAAYRDARAAPGLAGPRPRARPRRGPARHGRRRRDARAGTAAADALAFPSVKEGWGLAVLEAHGRRPAGGRQRPAGVPRVPARRAGRPHGPPGQPTLLADAMRRLTTDAELRTRLRLAGPRVAGRFRWDDTARSHQSIYGRLAQRWATRLAH